MFHFGALIDTTVLYICILCSVIVAKKNETIKGMSTVKSN